jgi:hypothetical protein
MADVRPKSAQISIKAPRSANRNDGAAVVVRTKASLERTSCALQRADPARSGASLLGLRRGIRCRAQPWRDSQHLDRGLSRSICRDCKPALRPANSAIAHRELDIFLPRHSQMRTASQLSELGHKSVSVACEPSLWSPLPMLRGNGFWPPETEGPELASEAVLLPLQRLQAGPAPRKTAGIRQTTGNLG